MKTRICALAAALILSSGAVMALPASAETTVSDSGYSYSEEVSPRLKGWQESDGKTYYYNKSGKRCTGWKKIDGSTYFFSRKGGFMRTGRVKISGKVYTFAPDGKLVSGYSMTVSGNKLDSSNIPYYSGKTLMVPLGEISTALGYKYSYDKAAGKAIVDDDYIQSAEFTVGSDEVKFTGKLQVIDLSREINLVKKAVDRNGCVYVPLELFEEFFNDVSADGGNVTVSPSMCYVDGEIVPIE